MSHCGSLVRSLAADEPALASEDKPDWYATSLRQRSREAARWTIGPVLEKL